MVRSAHGGACAAMRASRTIGHYLAAILRDATRRHVAPQTEFGVHSEVLSERPGELVGRLDDFIDGLIECVGLVGHRQFAVGETTGRHKAPQREADTIAGIRRCVRKLSIDGLHSAPQNLSLATAGTIGLPIERFQPGRQFAHRLTEPIVFGVIKSAGRRCCRGRRNVRLRA